MRNQNHTLPYYTKFLAESIVLNKNENQYFISTHNPYFLLSILEKAPKKEVNISITYLDKHQTKIKSLNENEIQQILELNTDTFFNINDFIS